MTQEKFLEKYNYAPFDEEEIAWVASKVSDNKSLFFAAINFLESKDVFEAELEKIVFEFG